MRCPFGEENAYLAGVYKNYLGARIMQEPDGHGRKEQELWQKQ
jgi:hypothetical protein